MNITLRLSKWDAKQIAEKYKEITDAYDEYFDLFFTAYGNQLFVETYGLGNVQISCEEDFNGSLQITKSKSIEEIMKAEKSCYLLDVLEDYKDEKANSNKV